VLGLPWFRDRTAAEVLARDHGGPGATKGCLAGANRINIRESPVARTRYAALSMSCPAPLAAYRQGET